MSTTSNAGGGVETPIAAAEGNAAAASVVVDGAGAEMAPAPFPSHFSFGPDYKAAALFRHWQIDDFIRSDYEQVEAVSHTFQHEAGVRVTLIPVSHVAHPQFYSDVDVLCGYHQSVLMEGRYGNLLANATVVPARKPIGKVRPQEEEDSEGWEPIAMEDFHQPFSWGVAGSKESTVVHAADKYDFESMPQAAGARFSTWLGGWKRDKHCLQQIPELHRNGYTTFAIPWGAAHLPVMATLLEQNGFKTIASQRVVMFNSVDGPISEAWVRHLRISLRAKRWFWLGVKGFPGLLPVWLGACWMEEEVLVYVPSPRPFIPWQWGY